jgi:predicted RNA-binding protein with PIN domain
MTDQTVMIVDAYNIMHADVELESLMDKDLGAARESLIAELTDYCAREGQPLELVFDAGGRPGGISTEKRTTYLTITYTARGESADDYIERLIYKGHRPLASATVVTGDYAQQRIAQGAGVLRMAPREFLAKLQESREELREQIAPADRKRKKARLSDRLPAETVAALERLRKQQK